LPHFARDDSSASRVARPRADDVAPGHHLGNDTTATACSAMTISRSRMGKVILGHWRMFAALLIMAIGWLFIPATTNPWTRLFVAWDIGVTSFLLLVLHLFMTRESRHMPALAEAQEEGQWTIFWVALLVGLIGFFTVITELGLLKGDSGQRRILRIALVAATLSSSWLFTHVVFALRYAQEWYDTDGDSKLRRGLDFPGDNEPDYMDFLYFSLVLGMTFQVSDVQIKASRLRRLATLHGLVSFLYNTVILALSVNIAAGLL
jgi:uncharacterized membrane protein